MTSLSETQFRSLCQLWTSLSPSLRDRLRAATDGNAQLAGIFAQLDSELPETAGDASRSLLFRIFADVTGADDLPPTHARFSPASLNDLLQLAGLETLAEPDSRDSAAQQEWRNDAAAAIRSILSTAEADKQRRKAMIETLGSDAASLIDDAACLLENDAILYDALKPFPESISDLTPELVSNARDAHDEICSAAPAASLWFLKILTARLAKTAQIFRVVEKIGKRSDDALVSKTDLADIGDLVLANAEFYAGKFAVVPENPAQAEAAGKAVAEFVKISVGMTREFGIRKDGHWGKTLFSIRAKASASLEAFFKQVEKTFARALPHPVKGQHGLSKPGPMPKAEIIAQTEASLIFLAATSDWATQAAVGSAQKRAADLVRSELDECARGLLEILRAAEGEQSDQAAEAIALIVRYMRAFNDKENADLIQRRSVAVRANAA